MFWNGDRWLPDEGVPPVKSQQPTRRRLRDVISTGIMVLVLAGLTVPFIGASAATRSPTALVTEWTSEARVSVFQETSRRIAYRGTWVSASYSDYQRGRVKSTNAAGATARFGFKGTAIAWVGPVGPTRGKAKVYIDGTYVTTVNTWASSFRATRVLFETSWKTAGTHRIAIVASGTDGHPTVAIDAFIVRRDTATSVDSTDVFPSPTPTAAASATPPPSPSATPTATPSVSPSASTSPTATPVTTPPPTPAPVPTASSTPAPGWSDEFSSGLTNWTAKEWVFNSGYRVHPSQVSVSGGVLNLTSQYEGGGSYVSGTVFTNRTFDHGYFEARMKWPKGTGFDSSFWLYPEGKVTPAPEIDIIEAYPNDPYVWPGPNRYQATMHYVSGGVSKSHQITYDAGHDLTDEWHRVGAEWVPGKRITFYFDGVNIGSMTADVLSATQMNAMFSQILATWSAPPDESTPTTATMQVDWVRWWDSKP